MKNRSISQLHICDFFGDQMTLVFAMSIPFFHEKNNEWKINWSKPLQMPIVFFWEANCLKINEALLGGVHAPCSLQHFTPFSLLPSIFLALAPFYQFSLLLFHFSLLPAPFWFILFCSLLHFPIFCCSLLPFPNFCAPCSEITFSLLPAPFLILCHAPCSLRSKGPFSLLPGHP